MIGKAHRGADLASAIGYVLQEEKKPKVVYGNFPEAIEAISYKPDVAKIARRFENQAVFNRRVQKPLYHVSISPEYTEDLTPVDWSELADDFVKKMKLERNLVLGVLHHDTYYPNTNKLRSHLHLVINTVDCKTNKSADLYYDYFMVENLLRNFEEKFDKKREVKEQQPQQISSSASLKADADKVNSQADILSDLEKVDALANRINTTEANINGLDVAAYSIRTISSVAKIASLFLNSIPQKNDADILKLDAILEEAKNLENGNPLLLRSEDRFVIEEVSAEFLPEFIEKAERAIEKQKLLKPSFDDNSPKLTSRSDERIVEKDEVFDRFINYFQTVDSLNEQPIKEQYRVRGRTFGEVLLNNSEENKEILIRMKSESVYSSKFESEKQQWSISVDRLSGDEKKLIAQLPQSRNDVKQKQLENHLADYFDRQFDKPNAPGKITCFYGDKEGDSYDFYQQKDSDGRGTLRGVESIDRRTVFKAEISVNKAINVIENKIPLPRLEQFSKWHQTKHEALQEQNSKRQR